MSSSLARVEKVLRLLASEYGLEFHDDPPRATNHDQIEYRCWTRGLGMDKQRAVLLFPGSIRTADAATVVSVVRMALSEAAVAARLPLPGASAEPHIADLARQIHAKGGTPSELPIGQAFALTGRWRVYFNRHGAAGRPWCVAPEAGGWELAVANVAIGVAGAMTVYRPKATPDDEDGRPSAWIAIDGRLAVSMDGLATIEAP